MLTIRSDIPYAGMIETFLHSEFPSIGGARPEIVMEAIMAELISSGQIRYGPAPSPESLVRMRAIVRNAVAQNAPIPILVPAGGRKPVTDVSVDIAELCALRMMSCLQTRISQHYAPGVDLRVRLEDLGAEWLYHGEFDVAQKYTNDFVNLVKALKYDKFITPVVESKLIDRDTFFALSEQLYIPMLSYLIETSYTTALGDPNRDYEHWVQLGSYKILRDAGWDGIIPVEQREYYYSRYERWNPKQTRRQSIEQLARYLAHNLARVNLKMRGDNPEWNGQYLQLGFHQPIPGVDSLHSTRLYYRTVHGKYSMQHLPFWRARGVLRVNGKVRPMVVDFQTPVETEKFHVDINGHEYTFEYMIES